jgi:terminal uridylyltransferase
MSVETARAFYERASTGAYRGNVQYPYVPKRHTPQVSTSSFMTDQNSPAQGVIAQRRIYNPTSDRRLCDPNSHSQHDIHRQCQYLAFLAERETNKELNGKELQDKEAFRKRLEKIVQSLVADYAKDHVTVNPKNVRLKCYGSLASGFAVPGSDMDLLLMFPKDEGPAGSIEVESRRMIEKALLDLGYGARLLTKTRVPILRVCQKPGPELLLNLKKERGKWEYETEQEEKERKLSASGLDPSRLPSDITDEQSDTATVTFAELDTEPSIIPLPPSPARVQASLEYTTDVGIQCDINFSNYVAIHNTTLLRCYCKCDPRVRPMGLFVKEWSKARKINTPYHGTLSSYGYIMMVLHYLMNIADPPVIPNLQHLAKNEDAWNNKTNIELFEGFDVRFLKDEALLESRAQRGQITRNRETLGSLLRGFFRYYTDSGGFHWTNEVISIRTQGGVLTKRSKDWTEAKRAGKDNSIRLRYLFAIEDPFETDHNIGRTVGHSGIVAIRDEFRRAWNILSKIKYAEGRWLWHSGHGGEGEDLFAKVADRGDLLRKDQDYYREKMKRLNELEKKRDDQLKAAEKDRSASVEITDGRSAIPSHSKASQDKANTFGSLSKWAKPKLMSSGHISQDFPAKKLENLRKEVATDRKGIVDKGPKVDNAVLKNTPNDGGYDVSKWVRSITEANRCTEIDRRPEYEFKCGATQDTLPSQSGMEIKQEMQKVCCAPDFAVSTSKDPMPSKAPSNSHCRESSPAQGNATSEMNTCPTVEPKNPLSAWNVNTKGGSWLHWRDRRIRAGSWRGMSRGAPFSGLHLKYPYDTARPWPNAEQQRMIADVRAKRNLYFKPKGNEGQPLNTEEAVDKGATDQERKDSAVSMGTPPPTRIFKSKSGFQTKSHSQSLISRLAHGSKTTKAVSTSAFTLALSSNNPEVIHNPVLENEPVLETPLVPNYDPEPHDYRHDFPFPVPTAPDFQFDPAQLRDLGIIAKGGSGCARDALEQEHGAYDYDGFRNIELSNEWGGGGRMGEMVTDSGELPVPDFTSAGAKLSRGLKTAQGDEEGLLQELPAGW